MLLRLFRAINACEGRARPPSGYAAIWRPCSTFERPARSPVGAGLPAKRPALLANLHPPFTVAAATVFAGKPAPTTVVDSWTQPAVGAGSPAKRPAQATQKQQTKKSPPV
ncbi:hypothetical protein CIK02_19570 [Pseudomonas putida]|nr:hypothetical protein CIK02_19570 [Pseudomonas putida]